MTSKMIEIIVAPGGKSSVKTRGFIGASCRDASRFIEQALGQRTDEKLTSEFRHSESVRQTNQQRN